MTWFQTAALGIFIAGSFAAAWFVHELGHAIIIIKRYKRPVKLTLKGIVYNPAGISDKDKYLIYSAGIIAGLGPMFVLMYSGFFNPLSQVVLFSLYIVGCAGDIGKMIKIVFSHKTVEHASMSSASGKNDNSEVSQEV